MRVDDRRDLLDSGFEHTVRAGIRHHQRAKAGGMLFRLRPQIIHIDVAIGVRLDHDHGKARHDRACRIRAVRRLWNQTYRAVTIAP